jgi:uncharacterized protein involved in outer membrane biogenesis
MATSHKLLLIVAALFTAAVVGFVQSFNTLAGNNREQVHQELQKLLGKDATFEGLEASLWGGLGFSAKEFRVADNPRFAATPVVRAKELKLKVSLAQLLLGRIVINELIFKDPELQIITDERGLLNLSVLAVRQKELPALPKSRAGAAERKLSAVSFLVTSVKVKNGRVDFIDRSVKEPAEIQVKNVAMEVTGLNPAGKTIISFAAAVTEGLGHDVRINGQLGPLQRDHHWSQQPVELDIQFDSLSVPLLARALPFLRNRIPRELDVTGPMSFQAKLGGTFERPRITNIALKVPFFGSSNYNAILEGAVEIPEGAWRTAQLKGKLSLNPINLTEVRELPFFKQSLPADLATEGSISVQSQFEGSWENLRVGALINAQKSELRYKDWFRKLAAVPAQVNAQFSRQKDGLLLHESVLTLGNTKMMLSGFLEEGPEPRLRLRLRSDSTQLASWRHLVAPLSVYGARGTSRWDLLLAKNFAAADGWNIRGKLTVKGAEFRHRESGRKMERIEGTVSFLGKEALVENASFTLGSSRIAMSAKIPDMGQLTAGYQLRSPELNLMDLPTFPPKPNRIKNVTASGTIQVHNGAPLLKGTVLSSDGTLEGILYRDLRGDVTWSPTGISFKNLSLQALDGRLRSDVHWSSGMEQPLRFTLTSQVDSIEMGSLLAKKFPQLRNRLEGQLDLRGQFEATPRNGTTVAEAFQGAGETVIHDGTIRDFNLIATLMLRDPGASGASKVSSRFPASLAALVDRQDTSFDTLKASFKIEQQRIRTDDLLLSTPDYTISGAGWVGFDRTTQWNGVLVLSPRITQELQREYRMIRYLLDRRGRLSLSFRAEGKFPNVKVRPENRSLAQAFRRGFPQRPEDPAPGGGKSAEKNEKKDWFPGSLEELLKQ